MRDLREPAPLCFRFLAKQLHYVLLRKSELDSGQYNLFEHVSCGFSKAQHSREVFPLSPVYTHAQKPAFRILKKGLPSLVSRERSQVPFEGVRVPLLGVF